MIDKLETILYTAVPEYHHLDVDEIVNTIAMIANLQKDLIRR